MTHEIKRLAEELEVGRPLAHGGLSLVPLFWKEDRRPSLKLNCLMLEEAIAKRMARVVEAGAQGSVPRMTVVNESLVPLFVPDGTTLVGGKQNRVVNLSLLLAPESMTVIPVSCVEQGRWRTTTAEAATAPLCDPKLRSKMCEQTARSARGRGEACADQDAVWSHVGDMLAGTHSHSPTAAYQTAFDQSAETIAEGNRVLRYPRGAAGVAVQINGGIRSVDVFHQPGMLESLWRQIVPGAVLTAIQEPSQGEYCCEDVAAFVADGVRRTVGEFPSPGLGVQQRFEDNRSVGSALVIEETCIHAAFFSRADAPPPVRPQAPFKRSWRRFWRE